jgi:ribosomal RNA-processing protein 7
MVNLIKGYLPIRISLPTPEKQDTFENTFLFVKQHTSSHESSPRTLFVTNTPLYPSIQTSLILQRIFEKYADVEKIIVAPKPKKSLNREQKADDEDDHNEEGTNASSMEELTLLMFEKEIRSFGTEKMNLDEEMWCDQGRYAHIIFKTPRDMKTIMKVFQGKDTKKNRNHENQYPIVTLNPIEIQELQDISHQQFLLFRNKILSIQQRNSQQDVGERNDDCEESTGILALAEIHRYKNLPRDILKTMCNQIMEKYEQAEEEALRKQQEAMKQPDEDGFITVSYSTNVGDAIQFEQNGNKLGSTGGRRKRERTRSSKKNAFKGSDELPDFYRFQLKENKKRSLEELKHRFQEDLKRVKQMKDEKMFRPF